MGTPAWHWCPYKEKGHQSSLCPPSEYAERRPPSVCQPGRGVPFLGHPACDVMSPPEPTEPVNYSSIKRLTETANPLSAARMKSWRFKTRLLFPVKRFLGHACLKTEDADKGRGREGPSLWHGLLAGTRPSSASGSHSWKCAGKQQAVPRPGLHKPPAPPGLPPACAWCVPCGFGGRGTWAAPSRAASGLRWPRLLQEQG